MRLDPSRLWVTVFSDDDEAARIWLDEIGVPPDRLTRLGEKSNFWAMGDTGPCGPCTEIFYDHGAQIPGGPPGSPDEDGDRYVEIWNLVFMQYDRAPDGTLTALPKPSVDTGAGLERLSAVMQGVHSNYEIDLFQSLVRAAAALANTEQRSNPSLFVIADHIRPCSFLIADGVVPSNEGRGYVLRRIIRRAIRHGHKLGIDGVFFWKLVATLAEQMGGAYPELHAQRAQIERVLRSEEERFAETLSTGMVLLNDAIERLRARGGTVIDGDTVFRLYDTYGFPADLTADVARERSLSIDQAGFDAAMDAQRERARAASRFGVDLRAGVKIDIATRFEGYTVTTGQSRIVALLRGGERVAELAAGETGEVLLEATPFYAESGGQVGDTGELTGEGLRFRVEDTQKRGGSGAHSHLGKVLEGRLHDGDTLTARVDTERRRAIALNHSATHLLHAVLRQVLGKHVQQKGSLVAPDRLRFDFSHSQPVSAEELRQIEQRVNAQVRINAVAETREMPYDAAVAAGAIALFGEKYASNVRVLSLGDFSVELCGGTHVSRAGDIGLFRILSEGGVAAGVRRIEAATGAAAIELVEQRDALVRELAVLMRGTPADVGAKVREALERIRTLEKDNRSLRDKLASGAGTDLAAGAVDIGGVQVVATTVDGADAAALRNTMDQLKSRLKSAVIVLAATDAATGKVTIVAGVTADSTARIKAGDLVGSVAALVGGRGGGRADFAQAGGTDPARLAEALATVVPYVRAKLSSG